MAVLTLTEIKHHLRLDEPETAEDAQLTDAHLTNLSEAAEDHAAQYLGRSIPWTDAEGATVPVPASVKAAMLLIVGDLYENREAQIVGSIVQDNKAVERLLHFYRVGLGI